MPAASPAVLDDFLARYTGQVGSGFGLLQGDIQAVFGTLMVISLALTALFWALDDHQNVPAALVRKIMLFGFFAWLISGWHALSLTVVNGFAVLGLKAAGGSMSVGDLMHSPSKVVIDGMSVAFKLLKYIGRLAGEGMGTGFFTHFDAILVTGVAAVGVIVAFAVLGIHIMVTIIEFYIVTLIGFVTVPFGILTQTAFLSERAIGYVFAVGVKVMAIAIVISIGEQIFAGYTVSADPTWEESVGLLVAATALCMLSFSIPNIAAAQITGGPQLSAGAAGSAVVGLAATIGGVALAGRWAMGGGAHGKTAAAGRTAAGASQSHGSGGSGASQSGAGAAPARSAGAASALVGRARSSYRRPPPPPPSPPSSGPVGEDPADEPPR